MRKTIFGLIVLAFLAMAVPASAQGLGYIPQTWDGWMYKWQGNQVMMLTADSLGMVRGLTNQLRRSEFRSLRDDLRWNQGFDAIGLYGPQGFYPMYDRNRQPLSGRQRIERGAGIVAAADGVRRIINNPHGGAGWVEAAIGLVLVNDSRYRGQPNNQRDDGVIVTPPQQQNVRWASDGTPIAVGTRPNLRGPVSAPPSMAGDWKVQNRTSKRAELWDGEQFIARIEPWQSIQVDAPQNGYKAVLLIPNRSGGLDQEAAQIRSSDNFNGWDILVPAVQ